MVTIVVQKSAETTSSPLAQCFFEREIVTIDKQ
jgi:hypothetical protein